jgi:uncharacterized lipoprotein YbaY
MTDNASGAAVEVVVHLLAPADCGDLTGARLHISIEDVSMLDAPSTEVAAIDSILEDTSQLQEPVPIRATIAPGRDYAVRAYVSRSSAAYGGLAAGDLITTARHQLDSTTSTAHIELPLSTIQPAVGG